MSSERESREGASRVVVAPLCGATGRRAWELSRFVSITARARRMAVRIGVDVAGGFGECAASRSLGRTNELTKAFALTELYEELSAEELSEEPVADISPWQSLPEDEVPRTGANTSLGRRERPNTAEDEASNIAETLLQSRDVSVES